MLKQDGAEPVDGTQGLDMSALCSIDQVRWQCMGSVAAPTLGRSPERSLLYHSMVGYSS